MDETTIPFGDPELMRASDFRRYLQEAASAPGGEPQGSRWTSLSPSLMADLQRFEHRGQGADVLEVLAACLRHAQRVVIHCEAGGYVVPITLFPQERLFHCPADPGTYLLQRLALLRVLRLEPAVLRPPGDREEALVGSLSQYHPLAPLLWVLALHGARSELLPEVAGPASYRTAPGLDLRTMPMSAAQRSAIRHMRTQPLSVRELADFLGGPREAATRLLNALYLLSGLIVSRSLPQSPASWFTLRRR
ncbi:MAG TPA: hypothetical protein VNO84_05570 [Burkholderiaceae bacterium]|nr:hypothetical protein [Burkholderiaceae bacterium]